MSRADILRLDSPDPAVIAEQQLAEDGSRFVAFIGKAATSAQIAPRPFRLTRLDPRPAIGEPDQPARRTGPVARHTGPERRADGRFRAAISCIRA
jgi:alpha-galactosidase